MDRVWPSKFNISKYDVELLPTFQERISLCDGCLENGAEKRGWKMGLNGPVFEIAQVKSRKRSQKTGTLSNVRKPNQTECFYLKEDV